LTIIWFAKSVGFLSAVTGNKTKSVPPSFMNIEVGINGTIKHKHADVDYTTYTAYKFWISKKIL
jgi:hypothetical protein